MPSTLRPSGLGAAPGPTLAQPFELMEACHQRLERTLGLLQRLRGHLPAHGADDEARQAAHAIRRYFDQAAPHHHRDEELHVFPPLLQCGNSETIEVVRRLQADHARMDDLWASAAPVLQAVADGHRQRFDPEEDHILDELAGLYRQHITAEEQVAYPQARALFDQASIAAMGREMNNRRGNSWAGHRLRDTVGAS